MTTETPRTDALVKWIDQGLGHGHYAVKPDEVVDLARALERDLRECVGLLNSYDAIGNKDGTEYAWEQRKNALLARLKETP